MSDDMLMEFEGRSLKQSCKLCRLAINSLLQTGENCQIEEFLMVKENRRSYRRRLFITCP